MLPDEVAIPLLEGKRGPWRRYFPASLPRFNFEIGARCARAYFPASGFFLRKVLACLRRGEAGEAGRFAGVFSHYLGDFAEPAHYYELDVGRLMPPPPHMANCNFHMMIEGIESGVESLRHKPRLLGAKAPELLFLLEGRLAALHATAVASVLPMLRCIYRRRNADASKTFDRVMREAARVLADVCHTAHCVAEKDFDARQLASLRVCDLRQAEPWDFDVEFNFGQKPLIDAITVQTYGRAEPFRLRVKQGRRTVTQTIGGICAIPHALPLRGTAMRSMLHYRLPRDTYARFEATVGLLAGRRPQARCVFEVRADGRRLYRGPQTGEGDAAACVALDVTGCRDLKLIVHTDGSTDRLAYPVWGEPRLVKA